MTVNIGKTLKGFFVGLCLNCFLLLNVEAAPVTVIAQPMPVEQSLPASSCDSPSATTPPSNDQIAASPPSPHEGVKKEESTTTIVVPSLEEGASSTAVPLNTTVVLSQADQLKKLKEEFGKHYNLSKPWPQWTCIKKGFRKGDVDPALMTVKKQLIDSGDYVQDSSSEQDSELTPIFDKKLEDALKQFQRRHFLDDDGVIGLKTCKALNLTPTMRLKKIDENIERWQQLESHLKGRYVLVNIPTYNLYAMEDHKIVLSQPVVVGMKKRRTPLFTSPMVSIVLNPAWGVPVKIFVEDKLKRVLSDPEYLERHHYVVLDREGQTLSPNEVDWSHVSRHYFPYKIRQLPGEHNALRKVKFNLHNNEAIYLHDTPQVSLFHKVERAFSSGCVRLSAPKDLAVWALEGTKYASISKIDDKIKEGQTATLPLPKPIPVHFVYITVWVKEGKAFFSDPYDLDR